MARQVVIVGGGVIGLCTAWALVKRGCEVTVLDAGAPGGGASAGNAGWVVPSMSGPVPGPGVVATSLKWMLHADSPLYIKPRPDPALARWLLAFWRRSNARDYRAGLDATMALNAPTMALFDELRADGVAFEMHAAGLLCPYLDERALAHDLRDIEPLASFGYPTPPLLASDAIRELEPALTDDVIGGFFLPQERHLRPDSLCAGLVDWLAAHGATIHANTPATGFERTGPRATAVVTPRGKIEAEAILLATGAWLGRTARLAGLKLPIQAGKGYHLDYAPPPRPIQRPLSLHEARVAVTPLDGFVRLAGTMEFSGLNRRIYPARIAAIARAGRRYLRDWPTETTVAATWTGMRPMTPDGLPVIGLAPGFANLALAGGHAMLGVTLAPATAEAVADLLTSGHPPDVLQPFSPLRWRRA